MAHHEEPMDIDSSVCDFDNKENSYCHNNVLPSTEKGYEELDVSELNMKLRYSITPASSPMSKSYTVSGLDNKTFDPAHSTFDNENGNMTRSLHTTLTKNDKSMKSLPLKVLSTDGHVVESNRNVLGALDSTTKLDGNITVTVSGPNDIDENLSIPSSSSSMVHTPEATTPTNDIPKGDSSPIMRGLKSVLSMFRPSQSPIPPAESETVEKPEVLSPPIINSPETNDRSHNSVLASTPLMNPKTKDPLTKRTSQNTDSIVFNEDLEKELEWKDETTIIFSKEKIPIHKLLFQPRSEQKSQTTKLENKKQEEVLNDTVEYMDISCNDSGVLDKSVKTTSGINKSEVIGTESDSEFVDCESTFNKNESQSEQSFLSQEDDEPIATKVANLESQKATNQASFNASTETLANNNTADLSAASIDSTKTVNGKCELQAPSETLQTASSKAEESENLLKNTLENNVNEQAAENLNVTTQAISKVATDQNTALPDTSDANILSELASFILDHENVNATSNDVFNTPNTDILGVKSLSQIPLIVDPRVLLFNIPSDAAVDVKEEAADSDVMNISPADIPLPDDDDLDKLSSLPVIDLGTENISQFVEKINMVATTVEHIENAQVIEDTHRDNETPKLVADVAAIPPVNANTPEITANIEASEIQANLNKEAGMPAISDMVEAIDAKSDHPKVSEIISAVADVPKEYKNLQQQNDETIKVTDGVEFQNALQVENIPDTVKIEQVVVVQEVEPMDVSMIPDLNETRPIEDVVNVNSCITGEKAVSNENAAKCDEKPVENSSSLIVSEGTNTIQNEPDLLKDITTPHLPPIESLTVEEPSQNEFVGKFQGMEGIKQLVDDIVNTAVDIACDKKQNLKQNSQVTEENVTTENADVSKDSVLEIKKVPNEVILPADIQKDTTSPEITEDLRIPIANELVALAVEKKELIESDAIQMLNQIIGNTTLEDAAPMTDFISSTDKILNETAELTAEIDNILSPEGNNSAKLPSSSENLPIDITPQKQPNESDEEVTASKNNSPFVFVPAGEHKEEENFEELENPFASKSKIAVASPKIVSKGYNFNFDEIEDPFATKTKIRMSPTPGDSPNHSFEKIDIEKEIPKREINKSNRRKSQPEKKKLNNSKKMNSTFSGQSAANAEPVTKPQPLPESINKKVEANDKPNVKETVEIIKNSQQQDINTTAELLKKTQDITESLEKDNPKTETETSEIIKENKEASSSEQSAYYSAGASSIESDEITNAVKIPDTEDPDFNPFATQSKVRQSPLPEDIDFNPFARRSNICHTPPPNVDNINTFTAKDEVAKSPELTTAVTDITENFATTSNEIPTLNKTKEIEVNKVEDGDGSGNLSIKTSSSKTDKDNTVNTEDEDTIEGPFLEVDDLNNDEKMLDFDSENVDMMQFSKLQPEFTEHNEAGEIFIDAEAFEFLLNQNKCNTVSDSGKESLFLKFDPLFAKRMSSDGVVSALKQIQKRQSTPKKMMPLLRDETFDISPEAGPSTLDETQVIQQTKPLLRDATFDKSPVTEPSTPNEIESVKQIKPLVRNETFDKSDAGPSTLNETQDLDVNSTTEDSCDDLNITVAKPMMVVNPAVNPVVTPRNKTITPVRSNRQSLTFTSPAIAVIDRLLSMSSNNSFTHDTTVSELNRDNEADMALTQLRELLADKEISVYNLRTESKELRERLQNLETQMKSLEAVSEERLKNINELNAKLDEKTKHNRSMAKVVEEYERTIASLIAETEQDRKRHAEERIQLIKERDEQTAHLASMEVSFSDLHSKYEKSKQIILGFKANEDAYKKSIKDFEENLTKMQNNYELLKQHATSKLNHANEELQKINRAHEAEVLKLNAMIKRKELHITSLEETLQQKTKANEELTAICDELINKVG